MSGHNKWSKIKHKKGAADAKRSKVWTKIIREITVAARLGGDDPSANPRLRKAADDARAANMPKDTMNRAITKGSQGGEGADLEELVYEGYGPAGVALIVECMTDNRNRTSSDVRTVFNKGGGNLGTSGSVMFGFKKLGQLIFDKEPEEGNKPSEDQLLEIGLEAGVEDVVADSDSFVVTCAPEAFNGLREAFEKAGLKPQAADLALVPDNTIKVSGGAAESLMRLVETLEDLDDVQNVWSNFEIDEEEIKRLMAQ